MTKTAATASTQPIVIARPIGREASPRSDFREALATLLCGVLLVASAINVAHTSGALNRLTAAQVSDYNNDYNSGPANVGRIDADISDIGGASPAKRELLFTDFFFTDFFFFNNFFFFDFFFYSGDLSPAGSIALGVSLFFLAVVLCYIRRRQMMRSSTTTTTLSTNVSATTTVTQPLLSPVASSTTYVAPPPTMYAPPQQQQPQVQVPSASLMEVTAPPGSMPGQAIMIQTPSGEQFSVNIPAGVMPGQSFQVDVGSAAGGGAGGGGGAAIPEATLLPSAPTY